MNGATYRGLGFSLGMGWALLIYSEYLPQWLREALNLMWMAAWTFLVGFWSQTRLAFLGAVVILGSGLLILPVMSVLVPTPPAQWAAAALGLLIGRKTATEFKEP